MFKEMTMKAILEAEATGNKEQLIEALVEELREIEGQKVEVNPNAIKRGSIVIGDRLAAVYGIQLWETGDFVLRLSLKAWPKGFATVLLRKDGSKGMVNWK